MSETEEKKVKVHRPGKWFLRKGIGSWSSGTQVLIVNKNTADETAEVKILAGDYPTKIIPLDYLVERRARS